MAAIFQQGSQVSNPNSNSLNIHFRDKNRNIKLHLEANSTLQKVTFCWIQNDCMYIYLNF